MEEGMVNPKILLRDLISRIKPDESSGEREALAFAALEHFLGLSRTDILAGKAHKFQQGKSAALDDAVRRLNAHEPLQYITQEAMFNGRRFYVNAQVLIPRPETEELVDAVLKFATGLPTPGILDIGTGSGCIAVTLAAELQEAVVVATDVDEAVLGVARQNATRHNTNIRFAVHDILAQPIEGTWDCIVSNPPYIPSGQRNLLDRNVRDFEPPIALFVEDDDPLIFYRRVAHEARSALKPGGHIFMEINDSMGKQTESLFAAAGYQATILRDIQGHDRIVRATR